MLLKNLSCIDVLPHRKKASKTQNMYQATLQMVHKLNYSSPPQEACCLAGKLHGQAENAYIYLKVIKCPCIISLDS
jgi:hypothetical protein